MSLFYDPTIYRWGLYFLAFYIVDQIIFSNYINSERVDKIIEECLSHVMIPVVS